MKPFLRIFFFVALTAFRPTDDKMTVFLCGDSTMADKLPADAPETGWGMVLPAYFNEAVQVQNHAVNGRSTKSFITEGRWQKVISQVKKGDWVFIQFGHNDQKTADTTRSAPAQTLYRQNLIRFVNETRAKGGNPLLITPVMRRKFDENGAFVDLHGDYPQAVKDVAKELKVPMIDLHAKSKQVIEKHGVEGSKLLYLHYGTNVFPKNSKGLTDDTHFSRYGAAVMAGLVMESLMELPIDLKSFVKKSEFTNKYEYELPKYATPYFRKDTFNIARYGAKADGLTVNTKAIQQAIETCNAAGGGTVLIPAGLWVTGPLVLKNNVNLHLAKNALLQFSRNHDDYPIVVTTWEGQESYRCQAPIWGVDLTNIAITGEGTLDGGGDVWRAIKRDKQTNTQWANLIKAGGVVSEKGDMWYPSEQSKKGNNMPNAGRILNGIHPTQAELASYKDFLRPNMVSLTRCKSVLIEGVTFQNSPAWTLHPLLCDHVSVRNVNVKNYWYAQNSDAIDLESCRNGILEGCTFDTGDDGITIKSGRDEQGRKRGVPTENFIIKDCKVYHAHGGFVIGSEMSGGVRNLFVSNCTFMGSDVGLRFKTARGRGGVVENIYVTDINMTEIPGEAVLFDMYYAAKDPVPQEGESNELPTIKAEPLGEGTPQFKDFYIRNIVCKGAETAILVRGLPEMSIKNINIENAIIEANKGLVCVEGENINLKNVTLLTKDKTVMQVQNSKNVVLDGIAYGSDKEVLLKVMGDRSEGVRLLHTDASNVKKEVELGVGVKGKVVSKK
ncbi:MAG: glycosyl hydrolase family 28 protein [Spirosomataceae bacterium]